jgi:hypothetical protein
MRLLFWQTRMTVTDTGMEASKIEIDWDPKAGFTLIGSIAANGDTLSLFLVAKDIIATNGWAKQAESSHQWWTVNNSWSWWTVLPILGKTG